jgi:hypothetical protein
MLNAQVQLARRLAVPAIAIVLEAPVDVCLQRVGARRCNIPLSFQQESCSKSPRGHEGGIEGSGSFATGVVTRMSSDLKPVGQHEGFSGIRRFSHDQSPYLIAADILSHFGLPLQPNWVPLRDQSSGRLFYGNALTKETKWNRPSVLPVPRAPASARATEAPSNKLWVGNLHPLADKE